MKDEKYEKPKPKNLQVVFEFITLRKMLKMSMSHRATIKSFRPLFASKLDYEFAHIKIKVNPKGDKKTIIDTNKPLNEIQFFKDPKEVYVVEV